MLRCSKTKLYFQSSPHCWSGARSASRHAKQMGLPVFGAERAERSSRTGATLAAPGATWLLGGGAQLRARKPSNASLKAAGFWSGEPCRAFATVINCEPGMQRCAASESTLKNGRVNSPLVIVTGTLS